jgi:hypothetical protein
MPVVSFERPAQAHIDAVMARQRAALHWRPVDHSPLGIWVNRAEHRDDLVFEDIFDYRAFFKLQARIVADTLSVSSDLTPALAINSFGDGILPSMFGADLIVQPPDTKVIQDQGPWVVPLLHSAAEIAAVRKPTLAKGLFPRAADAVRYYRDNTPDWLTVVTPMRVGPLSTAMLLCGQAFYTNLYDCPKEIHHLLQVCTDLFIETEQRLFQLAGMSYTDTVTNFGISYEGALRIGDDVIINLRPPLVDEFVMPYYEQIGKAFGGRIVTHCCSMPTFGPFAQFDVLRRHSTTMLGASSQLGCEYYLKNQDELKAQQFGIEAGYGVGISRYKESYGSFRNWARYLAGARKWNTGLALYTEVGTVEEAQSMWRDWLEAQQEG